MDGVELVGALEGLIDRREGNERGGGLLLWESDMVAFIVEF